MKFEEANLVHFTQRQQRIERAQGLIHLNFAPFMRNKTYWMLFVMPSK
jgi:hypothetical protein